MYIQLYIYTHVYIYIRVCQRFLKKQNINENTVCHQPRVTNCELERLPMCKQGIVSASDLMFDDSWAKIVVG